MHSLSQCNKRTGRYRLANNRVSFTTNMAENGNLGNFEAVENIATAFAPKQSSYQNLAVGMENRKMHSPSRYNKRRGRYRLANYPVSFTTYLPENGNLENFEAVETIGTAFAPNQCSFQKVAVGMENSKKQSHSLCSKRTGRYRSENNQFSFITYMAENGNWENFEAVENIGTAFAPK